MSPQVDPQSPRARDTLRSLALGEALGGDLLVGKLRNVVLGDIVAWEMVAIVVPLREFRISPALGHPCRGGRRVIKTSCRLLCTSSTHGPRVDDDPASQVHGNLLDGRQP